MRTAMKSLALAAVLAAASPCMATMAVAATLSAQDRTVLTAGIDAGERKDWNTVRDLAYRAGDVTVRAILTWRYLVERDSGASFAEIAGFIEGRPNWPSPKTLQRNAEMVMPEALAPAEVIAFFGDKEPESGEGKLRLGVALYQTGDVERGTMWIRRGYIDGGFSGSREAEIRQSFAKFLTAEDDQRRLSSLIWEGRYDDARRVMGFVGPGYRKVAEARMKLRAGTKGAQSAFESVPQDMRGDFGLNFDFGRFLRQREQTRLAAGYMAAAIRDPLVQMPLDKWWDEKSSHVRAAIRDRRYQDAYNVAASAGLDEGPDYAEAQFLAGWVALRFLNDPQRALAHFAPISAKVFTPISFSRGDYWTGRAYEALGDNANAIVAYQKAAQYIETYYGQLAALRIQQQPQIVLDMTKSAGTAADPGADELLAAVEMLNAAGDDRIVMRFVTALAEGLQSRADYERATDLLWRMNRPQQSIRVAKRGMQRGYHIVASAYPVLTPPAYQGNGTEPEMALTLSLMRQESEFNPLAVSKADARGIMQLLPSTARAVANKHGIGYDAGRLLSDWGYNSQLGRAYLADNINTWNGSYIMTFAAYNAGGGRVRQWIGEFGDPRSGTIDPVDWVERIPFSETRNYVMRLTETTNVYRAVLAGGAAPLGIGRDMVRGGAAATYEPSARPGF